MRRNRYYVAFTVVLLLFAIVIEAKTKTKTVTIGPPRPRMMRALTEAARSKG
jgi:hypothetical protein